MFKNKGSLIFVLVFIILSGVFLLWLVTNDTHLPEDKFFKIEIYHSSGIAENSEQLKLDCIAFLGSSMSKENNGFISPELQIHQLLSGGKTSTISLLMPGTRSLQMFFSSKSYDFATRREDEVAYLSSGFFDQNEFKTFSEIALSEGDLAVNDIVPNKLNDSTEFFIDSSLGFSNSPDFKFWNSLQSLKKHINFLVYNGRIKSQDVIKIYFKRSEGLADLPPISEGHDSEYEYEDVSKRPEMDVVNPKEELIPIDAGLKYSDYSNRPTWKKIENAASFIVKVSVEGEENNPSGKKAYSLNATLGKDETSSDLNVRGGENKLRKFVITLLAFDQNGIQIPLKNNVLNGVRLSCTN